MDGLGGIQVATDFSEGAHWALERAKLLPLRRGASVELLHVAPADAPESEVRKHLEALGKGDIAIARGKPFVEIVRSAHHGRFELVVLGRHGERTFRDQLIGSTAERVIRAGDVSVLVVARPPQRPYRRALVAVDLSHSSRLALQLALRISDENEPIVILHAFPSADDLYGTDPALAYQVARRRADDEALARDELTRFAGEVAQGRRYELVFAKGDPRQVIVDAAQSRGADLLALGTRGRTGLAHLLIGSVAEGVLRGADTDVLVARLPAVDFRLP